MGQKAKELVEKDFDIDQMVRLQERLYRALYEDVPLKEYYQPQWDSAPKPKG